MHRKKHILFLSTIDYGGAGIGAQLVVEDLKLHGYDVDFLVYAKRQKNKDTLSFVNIQNPFIFLLFRISWLIYRKIVNNILCKGVAKGNVFSVNHSCISARSILRKLKEQPDLIIVGWTDLFVSTQTIKKLYDLTNAKIVYLMVDNYPITGGCHYPFTCEGYKEVCLNCPVIGRKKIANKILLQKKKDLEKVELFVLGTTNDCNRARFSTLLRDAHFFPFVQANKLPKSGIKQIVREKLTLGKSDFVIFFGAQDVDNPRKGFHYLVEALYLFVERIREREVILLIAGNYTGNLEFGSKKVRITQIGHVSLSELYDAFIASDVFVCPSVEDSGPMMINYSIGLGVPVIAFKMGVALDLVISDKTGYLIDLYDIYGMAEAIFRIYKLSDEEREIFRRNCLLLYEKKQTENSLIGVVDQILLENFNV